MPLIAVQTSGDATDKKPNPNEENLSNISLFLELLGTSSINFDYRTSKDISFRLGIGIGELPMHLLGGDVLKSKIAFATINRFVGKKDHLLEAAAGVAFGSISIDYYELAISKSGAKLSYTRVFPSPYALISIAYRYQRTGGGLLYRFGISSFIFFDKKIGSIWIPGVALGYTF